MTYGRRNLDVVFCPALPQARPIDATVQHRCAGSVIWVLCALALLVVAQLSATHPATIYRAFHGWFIGARELAILNGAPTLFSWPGATPVSHAEISRAVLLADAALPTMTCGWILAAHRATKLDFL